MARRLPVLLLAAGLSFGVLLGFAVAPVRADALTLPAEDGWRVCAGETGELTMTAAASRSESGAQFANAETLVVTVAGVADDEAGGDLTVTLTDDEIALPDDWESLSPGAETDDTIELELRFVAATAGSGSAVIELAIEGYQDVIAMTLKIEVRKCPLPPLGGCGNLVPDVVAVGDTLDFHYPFVDLGDPEPYLVFTREDGTEMHVSGGLWPDLSWQASVPITEDWIGAWTVAMYIEDELLCSEPFAVSGPATTPSPGPTQGPVAGRTPRITLPPTDARAPRLAGDGPLLVVLASIAAVCGVIGVAQVSPGARR